VFYDTLSSVPSYYNLSDTLQWNYSNLLPGEQRQIAFKCRIGVQNTTGTYLIYNARIDTLANDSMPTNNLFSCQQIVVAACDPNYKAVFPEDTIQPLTFNDYLTYNVHFQNTGNDSAVNIIVLDTLEAGLDLNTFEFLGSSDTCTWTISNRILRVTFNLIMLPDSTINFDGSQGFFTYRMKPILPVTEGEVIPNSAAIYFDYNDPVITNTASTLFSSLIITSDPQQQNNSSIFAVYPNPASSQLTILATKIKFDSGEYEIFDLAGNSVVKGFFEKGVTVIYLPSLENGMYLLAVHDKTGYSANSRFVICH
jgi:uncharacterized repeat protein (TIGR01451 family)